MAKSQQRQLALDLLEGLPSIGFVLLWRQTGDLEFAGWLGSSLALAVFIVFKVLKGHMHPVLLGVNCHILFITPLIMGLYSIGADAVADLIVPNAYGAVLATVTVVGVVLTVFSRGGFAGTEKIDEARRHRLSLLMIAVSTTGTAWALAVPNEALLPVVATLTLLIVGRRFLLARWSDDAAHLPALAGGALHGTGQPDPLV